MALISKRVKVPIIIIIITSSYIAHFTIMSQCALHLYPGHWANNHSCNLPQLPGEYTALVYRSALKTFSNTISTSTLAGTHLYSWVKRSNHSKASCSRTQVHVHVQYHSRGQDSNPHQNDSGIRTRVRRTKPLSHGTPMSFLPPAQCT